LAVAAKKKCSGPIRVPTLLMFYLPNSFLNSGQISSTNLSFVYTNATSGINSYIRYTVFNQQPGSKITGTWVLRRHSYFWVRPYGIEEF
jgi:hypothetical protein